MEMYNKMCTFLHLKEISVAVVALVVVVVAAAVPIVAAVTVC
jgi:hypothetical protein